MRSSSSLPVLFYTFLAVIFISSSLQAHADACTVPGTRPATSTDAVVKNGLIPVGTCYDPNDANIGKTASDTKEFVRQYATKGANISCLNAQFAEKVKAMIQALPLGFPKVVIDSGYRSAADQQKAQSSGASKVGPCGSYHQYGAAVDLNNTAKQTVQWVRANASQFGLAVIGAPQSGCFPSGFCDPAHVQVAGNLPSRDQCMASCGASGGYGLLPDSYSSGPAFPGTTRILPNPFQTMPFIPTTAPISTPTPSPTTNPTTNPSTNPTQPKICDPKFTCTANVRSYRSSSCTNQVIQTCSAGCATNGTDCAISTSTAATSTNSSGTGSSVDIGSSFDIGNNTNDNTNENSNPSVSTLLNSLANTPLFSSAEVGTTAPTTFVLNASTGDIEQLNAQGGTGSIAPGTITSVQPTGPQTFTSTGFTTGYTDGGTYSPQQVSAFQTILGNLKSSLLWALSVLNPFGSRAN